MPRNEAAQALMPILKGCADVIASQGFPDAMAGPYVRGDVGTVDKHLAAYETVGPTQLQMYAAAALCGLPHAAEKAVASSDDVAAIEVRLRAVLDSLASARL